MAIVITPSGKKLNYKSKNEKFSIIEISEYLDGIVKPVFAGNNWIFVNENGIQLKLPYNQVASAMLGFNIYGLCLIVSQDELPCQFFILNENQNMKNYQQINRNNFESAGGIDYSGDEFLSNIYKKEQEKLRIKQIYLQAYKNLIENKIPFEELKNNFIVYKENDNIINTSDYESRIDILNKLIDFFTEEEDYEKCIEFVKLKTYLEESENG